MIRAARHVSRQRVQFLLDQLLFYHRFKLLMCELQFRLEETMGTLFDLGFEGHEILQALERAHQANRVFIFRCTAAMNTLQSRLLDTFTRRLQT